MTSKSQQKEALEQQKNVTTKLCHFINYLLLVNCQNQINLKGEKELEDLSFLKEGNPWIEDLTKKCKKFNEAI